MSKSQLKKQAARMFNIETEAYQMNYEKRLEELYNQPQKPRSKAIDMFMAISIMSAMPTRGF